MSGRRTQSSSCGARTRRTWPPRWRPASAARSPRRWASRCAARRSRRPRRRTSQSWTAGARGPACMLRRGSAYESGRMRVGAHSDKCMTWHMGAEHPGVRARAQQLARGGRSFLSSWRDRKLPRGSACFNEPCCVHVTPQARSCLAKVQLSSCQAIRCPACSMQVRVRGRARGRAHARAVLQRGARRVRAERRRRRRRRHAGRACRAPRARAAAHPGAPPLPLQAPQACLAAARRAASCAALTHAHRVVSSRPRVIAAFISVTSFDCTFGDSK